MSVFRSCLFAVAVILSSPGSLVGDEPSELATSRANYQKALERATAPIHEKYLQHLKQLQSGFTRQNDLDSAIAVRKEIEALEAIMKGGGTMLASAEESAAASMEDELVEWLEGREFRWEGSTVDEVILQFSGSEVRAEADGKELLERSYSVIAPNAIQFTWSNGELNTFKIDDRKRTFTRFIEGSGNSHPGTIHARSKL